MKTKLSFQQDNLPSEKKGSAYVVGNGCPENRMDVARAGKYLVENGWYITKNWQDADLILFNACGRSADSASFSINTIKEIQSKKRKNQQLVVWGCLPKIDLKALTKEFNGLVSPGSELQGLQQIIGSIGAIERTTSNELGPLLPFNRKNAPRLLRYEGPLLSRTFKNLVALWENYVDFQINLLSNDKKIFYIKICSGCQSNCSYCAIQKSRGTTTSKSIEEILLEFQKGLKNGFRRFSLMGTDLGSYGSDIDCSLVDLLTVLTKQEGIFKISLRNVNPHYLISNLNLFIPILRSGKIRYIETAAESGSDRILRLMNRKYTKEAYVNCIAALRSAYPKILIRTQLMVGFPTETEQEFLETMKLLDEVIVDYTEVYRYSERPGTISERIEPKVPDQIIKQRYLRLYRKALLNRTPRKIRQLVHLNET